MTNSIWEIAANTPWWVYALFAYLIRIGFKATQPRIVPIRKILVLPLLFIALSFFSMYNKMQLTIVHLAFWMSAFTLSVILGWLQFRALKIKAIKNSTALYVPGTWSVLIIIFIVFAIKYYTGYLGAVDPTSIQSKTWIFFFYGAFTGLFVGRTIYAIRCMIKGPYVSL